METSTANPMPPATPPAGRRRRDAMKPPRRKRVHAGRIFSISFLPSVFTLTSLFLGFQALLHIVKGNTLTAIYFVALCVVLDGFDGTIARLTKTESDFGVQLDSLNDGVTFGLTVAALIHYWGFPAPYSRLGGVVAFVFLSAGLIRLARFNVFKGAKLHPSNVFIGLPIPVGALAICSWVLVFRTLSSNNLTMMMSFSLYSILISLLMVSNIHYHTIKNFNLKQHLPLMLIMAIIVGSAIIFPFIAIPAVTGFYLVSPILSLFRHRPDTGEGSHSHPLPEKPPGMER